MAQCNGNTRPAEPGSSTLKLETDYGYDPYGNLNSVTQKGSGFTNRTTSAQYDASGEFPATVTDALTNITNVTFDPSFGGQASVTDPNSVQSSLIYDTFGRPSFATKSDTNKIKMDFAYCSGVNSGTASCPSGGAYVVTTTPETSTSTPTSGTQNGVMTKTYYDALNRPIAADTEGFDGPSTGCTVTNPCWIRTTTVYDAAGHVQKISRPYFTVGGTAVYTSYTYDALDRITQATFPDTSHTTYCYHGVTTSTTNANSQTKVVTRNAHGLVATVIDAANGNCQAANPTGTKTTYAYDAFDDPLTITDNNNNTITNTFDTRGRRTTTNGPDMGSLGYTYGYDALSELTSQTDPKSQNTTLTYDKLMRPTSRSEADLYSKWTYDTATNGIGKLANTCTVNGACSSASYWMHPTYDSFGRVATVPKKINGTTYTFAIAYNSDGRIDTVSYPSGFVAKYVYTALGYLQQIKDNASGTVFWTANARDAELRLTQQTAGNGVVTTEGFDANTGNILSICASTSTGTCNGNVANFAYNWDAIGNLNYRKDNGQGWQENFCYDSLNRLIHYNLNDTCTGTGHVSVDFDALGNITRKSDICNPGSQCMYYGETGFGPHQLDRIAGTYNGVTNPAFAYDLNGNMTGGGGRTVSYTSFNMAASVTNTPNSSTDTFTYDTDHARLTQVSTGNLVGTNTYITDPVTGTEEEQFLFGSTVYWHDHIYADGQMVATRACQGAAPCTATPTIGYLVSDHLGSISVRTDASGAIVERLSYDAWGKRRSATDGSPLPCGVVNNTIFWGFTGHEMLDSVCLINMNARLYDQSLGQFQSADSIIPNRFNSQSCNRYAYVLGNPLAYVDPSGRSESDLPPDQSPPIGCGETGFVGGIETTVACAQRYQAPREPPEGLGGGDGGGDPRKTKKSGIPPCPRFGGYFGGTVHSQFPGNAAVVGAVGQVMDLTGNVSIYVQGGGGRGVAPTTGEYFGVDIGGFSNGLNQDFAGPFGATSATIAEGEGGGVEFAAGYGTGGQVVYAGGISGGVGEGVTNFNGVTYTVVGPPMPPSLGPLGILQQLVRLDYDLLRLLGICGG